MVYLYQLVQFHCSAYLDQNCLLFVHLHIVISERAVPRSSPPWVSSSFLFPSQLLLGFLLSILWIYLLDSANGSKFCVSFFFHMHSDKIWQGLVCVMLHLFPFVVQFLGIAFIKKFLHYAQTSEVSHKPSSIIYCMPWFFLFVVFSMLHHIHSTLVLEC